MCPDDTGGPPPKSQKGWGLCWRRKPYDGTGYTERPSPLLQSRLSPTCQEAASSRKTSLTPSPQAASWLLSLTLPPGRVLASFLLLGRRERGGVFSLRGCDGGRQGGPCRDRPSVRGGWSRGTALQRPLVETLPVTSQPAAWDVLAGSREGMRRGGCPKTPLGAAPSRERRGVLGRARVLIPSVASRCLPPVWVECAGGLGDRGPGTRDRQGMVPPGQWQRRPWGVGHPWTQLRGPAVPGRRIFPAPTPCSASQRPKGVAAGSRDRPPHPPRPLLLMGCTGVWTAARLFLSSQAARPPAGTCLGPHSQGDPALTAWHTVSPGGRRPPRPGCREDAGLGSC